MLSFVYVIGSSDNPVKIGLANRPEVRLVELNVGNPDPLILHYKMGMPSGLAIRTEKKAHELLAEHHRRGEWFNVDVVQAVHAIEEARELCQSANDNIVQAANEMDDVLSGHTLDPWAPHALNYYQQNARRLGKGKITAAMRGAIVAGAGQAALTAFVIFVERRTDLIRLRMRDRKAYDAATTAVAAAMNALAVWYRERREQLLLDEISGNAA